MVGKEMLWAGGKMELSQILLAIDFGLNPILSHASAELLLSAQLSENCRFIPVKSCFSSTLLYHFPHGFSLNYFNSLLE